MKFWKGLKKPQKVLLVSFCVLLASLVLVYVRIHFLTKQVVDSSQQPQSLRILDRNGRLLYEKIIPYKGYSRYRNLDEINPYFKDSLIALEDKNFYSNTGVDLPRAAKCAFNIIRDSEVCGASTITQQYVKLSLGHSSRGLKEKVEETLVSLNLNLFLSKDEILERYLNTIYFGNMRYGVESASQGYFGKENTDLDLAQVSFLAGIPNSPQRLDPYSNFDEVKESQQAVLRVMFNDGKITEQEFESIQSQELNLESNFDEIKAPHFVQSLKLDSNYDEELLMQKGEIRTTLDLGLYEKALKAANDHLEKISYLNVTNAAVVVLDAETGEVLVLLGSKDYFSEEIDGQVNAARSLHQPGSTLKPFIYALSFENNFTPATLINDREQIMTATDGKIYVPANYDNNDHGFVPVRETLANSYNIPAVVTLKKTGVERFYNLTDRVGLEEIRHQRPDIAASLGGCSVSLLDLANAYRILPNEGEYLGNPSFLKAENSQKERKDVLGSESNEIAFLVSSILSDNDARRASFGSLSVLNLPFEVSAKTGTASDFRDSWTIGYTKEFVVGVWVGNNDNNSMFEVNGTIGAAPIWHEVMLATYDYYKDILHESDFEITKPEGVVSVKVCHSSGEIFSDVDCDSYGYDEYFLAEKTPINEDMLKVVDVLEPDLITITDPIEGDIFTYTKGTKIQVEFLANSDFDTYILQVDRRDLGSKENKEPFWWEIERGKHVLRVNGVRGGERFEGFEVRVSVE